MKLLAIDTSSGQCSVALLLDGALSCREQITAREHARLLLPMVDALLAEGGVSLRALDGIAFGRGPGSFTGVRIAAAVTQGLAAGADLPVLPVSSLRALAEQARRLAQAGGVLPAGALLACLDARMGEVYWGTWSQQSTACSDESVSPPQVLLDRVPRPIAAAAGKGLGAYPAIADSLRLGPHAFVDVEPHARDIASLAAADLAHGAAWLDAALAQPVYLRNEVTQPPKPVGPGAL